MERYELSEFEISNDVHFSKVTTDLTVNNGVGTAKKTDVNWFILRSFSIRCIRFVFAYDELEIKVNNVQSKSRLKQNSQSWECM